MNFNRFYAPILGLLIFHLLMATTLVTGCADAPVDDVPPPAKPPQADKPDKGPQGPLHIGKDKGQAPNGGSGPVILIGQPGQKGAPSPVSGAPVSQTSPPPSGSGIGTEGKPPPPTEEAPPPPTEEAPPPKPVRPESLAQGVEPLLNGLMATFSFRFGVDKPRIDYDPKITKGTTLNLYLGVKPAVPNLGNQLVLIAPELKDPLATNKGALRGAVFEGGSFAEPGLGAIVREQFKDAEFTIQNNEYDPIGRGHSNFHFTKLGPYREYLLFATGENLTLPRATLTEQKDIDQKAKYDKILSDHHRAVEAIFKKFLVLDKNIVAKDLDRRGPRPENKDQFLFGPTVENLIAELKTLLSKNTDAQPHSVYAAIKPIQEEVKENNFTDEDITNEKFLAGKEIFERVFDQIDSIGDRCRTKWQELFYGSFLKESSDSSLNRRLAVIYEQFCDIPISYFKDAIRLSELKKSVIEQAALRGIDTSKYLDIYAKRASAYLDKMLASLIPITPPPTEGIPEPPKMPPVEKPTKTEADKPTPPPRQKPPTVITVSALQKPIDTEAQKADLLASRKVLFGFDARVLDPSEIMSDEVRKLNFYIGVRGKGANSEKPPYKLYLIGPRLEDENKLPLDVKANYSKFFDASKNLIYPLDNVVGLEKETAAKAVFHEGRQIEVPSITKLPDAEANELYDQNIDGAAIKERDEQLARLKEFNGIINARFDDRAMQKAKGEINGQLGDVMRVLQKPEFAKTFEGLLYHVASRITEFDIFATGKATPWAEPSLGSLVAKLEKDTDVSDLKSHAAASEVVAAHSLLKLRTQGIKDICLEVIESIELTRIAAVQPIAHKESISLFHSLGCREASNNGDLRKGPASTIRAGNAKSCMKQIIDEHCLLKAERSLEKLDTILQATKAQEESITQAENNRHYLVLLEELVASLTKKYQEEKPQKSIGDTLQDALRKLRRKVTGEDDD